MTPGAAAALPVLAAAALLTSPGAVAADPSCTGRHWVGAWAASPSDAQGARVRRPGPAGAAGR